VRAHAPGLARVEAWLDARPAVRVQRCGFASALAALVVACAPGVSTTHLGPPPGAADRALIVRLRLENARQFESQGRSEQAERALRQALAAGPDDAVALRALARHLEQSGRAPEALPLRARADAVAPPAPPLPDLPLGIDTRGLLVLLSSVPAQAFEPGLPVRPSEPLAADALAQRIAVRLPGARIAQHDPASVDAARGWLHASGATRVLALGLERADCASTRKDGPFARVWLRVAVASAAGVAFGPSVLRETDADPAGGQICVLRPVGHAFERALADPALRERLAAAPPDVAWLGETGATPAAGATGGTGGTGGTGVMGATAATLRAVFPGLGLRLAAELERGRAELARGRLRPAERAFARAAAIDADDPDARAYLEETRATLALARDLHGAPGTAGEDEGEPDDLVLSRAEREAAERELADEQHRRDQLLAAVAVLSDDEPAPGTLREVLRPVELPAEETIGLRLAREHTHGPVERRALFAPDGRALASWYFDARHGTPVLREEDRNRDGRAETWALWHDGRRSEVLEDRSGSGRPDTRVSLGADGSVARIEMTSGAGATPSRVFEYDAGRLSRESRDTNGDGVLDRFERFDADGEVQERAEDLDGDGEVDMRSFYRNGRLVRREIVDPLRVQELM